MERVPHAGIDTSLTETEVTAAIEVAVISQRHDYSVTVVAPDRSIHTS